ncbi:MAG: mechanosensitive ion channel [Porticoccaceae bacterium]|nr:mechanosensitive ion channel [Porticoccaceae bacterium]
MNATLIEINEVPLTAMGLLRVIFIIFIAWLVSRVLRRGLDTLAVHNQALSPSAIYTLGRVIHYLVLVLGIIIGLSSIGLDFTKFALFASALGVGIGFGLQNLIGNFVSGLIILFEKSLKVGDFVELSSGLAGEVKEINMRGTLITTNDNIDIIVPNSDFVNNQVTNWTLRETERRIHIPFGVAYGTDKDTVKKAALEAADAVTWTLNHDAKRQPQVWFVQFGDSSLNFELIVWLKAEAVKKPGAVQAAYLWEIDTKLKEHGIEIPFPQRDLHLRSVFGQKDEAGLLLLKRQNEVDPGHQ